jgi:hypothetical protein
VIVGSIMGVAISWLAESALNGQFAWLTRLWTVI